ncbi:MAG: hypothetical protein K2P59_12590 [Acetatifactor sp.]|nr:hypothetical protein [Acetatifactor sp.]
MGGVVGHRPPSAFLMNELDFINTIAEIIKKCIDNNPDFTEWEKVCRKAYEDEIKALAKQYYHSLNQGKDGGISSGRP